MFKNICCLWFIFYFVSIVDSELCPAVKAEPYLVESLRKINLKKWKIAYFVEPKNKILSLFSSEFKKAGFIETLFYAYLDSYTSQNVQLISIRTSCDRDSDKQTIVNCYLQENPTELLLPMKYNAAKNECQHYYNMTDNKIIGTDYQTFLILYGCQETINGSSYDYGLWILQGLDEWDKDIPMKILEENRIPTKDLIQFKSKNCLENFGNYFFGHECKPIEKENNFGLIYSICFGVFTIIVILVCLILKMKKYFDKKKNEVVMFTP